MILLWQIVRPAFTVIRDIESKSVLVFIRGTRSLNDTLTAALCAPVSFEHRRNNNIVSGHAHRGMVAAAGWIKKHCTPILLDALRRYPDFEIKVYIVSLLLEIKSFGRTSIIIPTHPVMKNWKIIVFSSSFPFLYSLLYVFTLNAIFLLQHFIN